MYRSAKISALQYILLMSGMMNHKLPNAKRAKMTVAVLAVKDSLGVELLYPVLLDRWIVS